MGAELQAQDATVRGLKKTLTWWCVFGVVRVAEQRWGHVTRAAGWGLHSRIHAVGDGAEWIRWQSREVFGAQASLLCDFFHVSEYLGAAAPVCQPAQPDRWRRTQQ